MTTQVLAIVFGLSPTGLTIARSLARHGVPVIGVDGTWFEVGHFSKDIRHDSRFSRLPPGPMLVDELESFGRSCEVKPVFFAASDAYVDFLAVNRARLEAYFVMADSMRPEINSVFVDKRLFYEACLRFGVVMPQTFFPNDENDVLKAADSLRYPAIIKPTHGFKLRRVMHGNKLIEVKSADELMHWWRVFCEWQADVVIQECIPGPEGNIAVGGMYMSRDGNCLSMFTAKKYRQQPPMYGSGSYMEAKWLPEVADLSVSLMKQFNYHGICGTEYKWDGRDRKWKLIEVNSRPTLWFALTRAAGVDVVWDAYCDLLGQPNPVTQRCQNDKMRWQFFVRDIASSLYYLRRGELSWREFFRTTVDQRRKEWAVCAWNDWGANLGYIIYTAMQIWTKLLVSPRHK
jgi:predicted ATP-grasp superfamily ATP-dependent carboligase